MVCDNPLQNKLQKLPWTITNWTANILCQQKVQHMEIHSVASVAKAMTELLVKNDWKTGLDVEVNSSTKFERVLAGSQAAFSSFTAERLSHDNYIFLLHHVSCSYYKWGRWWGELEWGAGQVDFQPVCHKWIIGVPWEFWVASFIGRELGYVNSLLTAQCALPIAKELLICLDSYREFISV